MFGAAIAPTFVSTLQERGSRLRGYRRGCLANSQRERAEMVEGPVATRGLARSIQGATHG
jgi:hypothetical protein